MDVSARSDWSGDGVARRPGRGTHRCSSAFTNRRGAGTAARLDASKKRSKRSKRWAPPAAAAAGGAKAGGGISSSSLDATDDADEPSASSASEAVEASESESEAESLACTADSSLLLVGAAGIGAFTTSLCQTQKRERVRALPRRG